jgi:hypothetical protein
MPARAAKLCAPMTTASALGWYVYPPADFALRWDGGETQWSLLAENEPVGWRSLAGGYDGVLPNGREAFADLPESRTGDLDVFDKFGGSPPFINADPRGPDRLEISTGLLARTAPGWLLLVREPPNWPRMEGVQVYEGLIECEWYRSYVPTIIRLTTQNRIVRFHRSVPFIGVQVVPTNMIAANRGPAPLYRGIADFPDEVWEEFVEWRRFRQDPDRHATYVSRQRDRARS